MEIKAVKSRSFLSVVTLLTQSSYSALLGFAAFFILTLRSGAHLLGIYGTVLAAMAFFNYFTNLGLAAALIQKKKVEDTDLNSAFIMQFVLATVAVIIGFLFSSKLLSFYKDLPPGSEMLYKAMLIAFFILSLKTVPSVLLEKDLQIYKVSLVQMAENTFFYVIIIVLVLFGFELESLIVAVLARSIVGVMLIYFFRPWFPKRQFSFQAAKSLLRFGIPFQSNSFLALVKDDLLIIYLGSAIGLTNLGYVTFGKKYAEFSIRLVMDNINRVAFPLFSKFQKDAVILKKSVGKVLYYESLLIFPIIVGLMFTFDSLLKVIPGYLVKWSPALFSFYFFSISALLVSLSSPFINLFNAIGKVMVSLSFMVLWTALTWILIPIFIHSMGYNGISVAFVLMALTFILVIYVAKKYVDFSFSSFLTRALVPTGVMTLFLLVARVLIFSITDMPLVHVIVSIVGGALVYFTVVYMRHGKEVFVEVADLFKSVGYPI